MLGLEWYWWAFWMFAIYIGFSIRYLRPDEVAAVYFLSRRITVSWIAASIGPGGIYFIPAIFFQVYVLNINTQRTLAPGKKEDIIRHDDDPLAPGQVRAFRVIQAHKEKAWFYKRNERGEFIKDDKGRYVMVRYADLGKDQAGLGDDALETSVAAEVIAYAEWNIGWDRQMTKEMRAEGLYSFVENIGDSMDTAHQRIGDTMKGALQDLMGKITTRHTLEAKIVVEESVKERLEDLVGELSEQSNSAPEAAETAESRPAEKVWGINVSAVQIVEINTGHRIAEAMADESKSIPLRKKTVEDAKANKSKVELETQAQAFQTRELGKADADAFMAKAKVLETDGGRVAAQLEAAKEVLGKAGTVVVPGDPGGLISMLTSIGGTVNKSVSSASK